MHCGSLGNTYKRSSKDGKKDRWVDGYKEGDAGDVQGEEDELPNEAKVVEDDEQQTITDTGTKVSNAVGDSLHDTSDEDEDDPRPAKRRRLCLASQPTSSKPACQHGQKCRLGCYHTQLSPGTRDEIGQTHTKDRHGSLSAPDGYSRSLHTSCCDSPAAEPIHDGGAEYHEWGLQHASFKRTTIGGQTVFALEFILQDLHDLLALQASSHAPLDTRQAKRSARSAHSHYPSAQIKRGRPIERKRGKGHAFTPVEDAELVDLKEKQGLSWKDIAQHFPGRSLGLLQVHYCTKLKNKCVSDEDDSVRRNSLARYYNIN